MNNIFKTLIVLSTIMFSFSCKKNSVIPQETPINPTATEHLTKIGETYIIGANAKAVIYSSKPFETGYNEIYVALFDSTDGSQLSNGHFEIMPMMNMGTMQHNCPVENTEDTTTTNGYFKSAVVFSMAGNSSQWSLKLMFHNHKYNLEGEGTLGVNVIASSPSRFVSIVVPLDSNVSVFISLVNLTKPQVGVNDFEITLHKRASMMSFPSIDNYSVEVVPEMPSMGHGSPNNINPTLISNGHYAGKVNFTMTGLWRIHINLYKNSVLISNDQYFETTLQ
jgi:hypothetical protein